MPNREGLRSNRKMTQAGKEYTLDLLKTNRSELHDSMLNRAGTIATLLESPVNHTSVRRELERLDASFVEFTELTERIKALLEEEDQLSDEQFLLEVDQVVFNVKTEALQYLRHIDARMEPAKSIKSKSLKSNRTKSSLKSSSSSRKSVREKMIDEAAKIASLKAEAEYLANLASLKAEKEIVKREAKMKIYEQYAESKVDGRYESPFYSQYDKLSELPKVNVSDQNRPTVSLLNPQANEFVRNKENTTMNKEGSKAHFSGFRIPVHSDKTLKEYTESSKPQLLSTISELLKMQSAPDVSIDTFNGDPLEFKYFMTTFEEVIESKIDDARGRLTRLIQYTSGEAKDLVKGCVYLEPKDGFKKAKELLSKRFGDPQRVLAAYRKELRLWKSIKPNDSVALRNLFTFLVKTSDIITGHFDSSDNICIVVSKLPGSLRDRWNRKVYQIRSSMYREPNFNDLVKFIETETIIATDPLYSKEALTEVAGTKSSGEESKQKTVRTFVAILKCAYCEKKHDIDKCFAFKALELKDRGKWLLKQRLCFGCYRKGHLVRDCNKPRTCDICKSKHPTLLHGYKSSENKSAPSAPEDKSATEVIKETQPLKCNLNELCTDFISLCLIPVNVRFNNETVLTYALLDNCSQGTFIDDELLSYLNVKFEETNLSVKTLTGQETIRCKVSNGLEVKGISTNDSWINLPPTYSREELPADAMEAPTTDLVQQWPYLKQIENHLREYDQLPRMKVGLLIGGNCPKAIEPINVIPSRDNGPYEFETKLGWCSGTNVNTILTIHLVL